MCECLSFSDGSRHLCAACADELERLRSENAALRRLLREGYLQEVPEVGFRIAQWRLQKEYVLPDAFYNTPDAAIDAAVKAMKEAKP